MTKWKQYVGTKIVEACPMTLGEYHDFQNIKTLKNQSRDEIGYIVRYKDGYISWSPEEAFLSYCLCESLTFGLALDIMKQGKFVANKLWTNNQRLLYFVPQTKVIAPNLRGPCKEAVGESAYDIYINGRIDCLTWDDEIICGWTPNTLELMQDTWFVIKDEGEE